VEESSVLARAESATQFAAAVKAEGCKVAIDGFGQRSVSFAPLKTLRVDYVKMDGSIVRNLLRSSIAEQKVKAVVRVGEAIGVGVIAECVEETDILVRLKTLNVGYAQGFGIARPAPIAHRSAAQGG
jgi:EAL domain-containing protein (putative c-di-GMP-specific phosphodiesterase class I)